MSACKKCRNPIRFVLNTDTGRRIPVDAVPDEDGNVLARRGKDGELVGHVMTKGEQTPDVIPGQTSWSRWMPHFATCQARERRGRSPRPRTLFDDMETETR